MSKPFVFITGKVDRDGERFLPEGADFSRYNQNPVLLYMHERGKVIGRVEDIQLVDNAWQGTPVFDLADEEAAEIARKYDEGFLKGISVWADIIDYSANPALMLPGQVMPTFTKYQILEISIVDIPCNPDTTAKKYSYKGADIKIKEFKFSTINEAKMLSVKKALKVKDDATESDMLLAVQALEGTIVEKDATITTLEAKISNMAKEQVKKSAQMLVDSAEAAGKITAVEKAEFLELAQLEGGYDRVKSILDKKEAYKSITSQLGGGTNGDSKSWEAKKAARAEWSHTDWAQKDSAGLKFARENDKEFYQSLIDSLKK